MTGSASVRFMSKYIDGYTSYSPKPQNLATVINLEADIEVYQFFKVTHRQNILTLTIFPISAYVVYLFLYLTFHLCLNIFCLPVCSFCLLFGSVLSDEYVTLIIPPLSYSLWAGPGWVGSAVPAVPFQCPAG